MKKPREQVEAFAQYLDCRITDHKRLIEELYTFADNASGTDIYVFLRGLEEIAKDK